MEQKVAVAVLRRLGYEVEHVHKTLWRVSSPPYGDGSRSSIITIERILLVLARRLYNDQLRIYEESAHAPGIIERRGTLLPYLPPR